MSTRIFISSNPVSLTETLSTFTKTATVEAEYGEICVDGSVATLAHHGPRADHPCPCIGQNLGIKVEAIGISHLDLDTLGGVLRVLGRKPEGHTRFWVVAAYVDTHGVHKLEQAAPALTPEIREKLNAFWAWSEGNRLFPPRDGSVMDATGFFEEAASVLERIFDGDSSILDAGRAWAEAKNTLEADSLVSESNGVMLRQSAQFVNHLYGPEGLAVVAFNPDRGAVTVSLADPIEGISCCTIMQQIFGPTAGGHAGIAGTPRDQVFTLADAERVAEAMRQALSAS